MEISQHRQREETWPVMRSRAGVTCWFSFFLWERHYLKCALARETAKCAWRWICNVLLICWDHLEWFSVVQWIINRGGRAGGCHWFQRMPLSSALSWSWCFSLPESEQASSLLAGSPAAVLIIQTLCLLIVESDYFSVFGFSIFRVSPALASLSQR